jgi:hypothetical protein
MIVSRWVSVIRSVERIELPSTKQLMTCVRRMKERRFMALVLSGECIYYHIQRVLVNGPIYMEFRDALDLLCDKLDHADVAKALGISVQTVRQARLKPDTEAFRTPPKEWENTIIRLAEERLWHYRRLIEQIRDSRRGGQE